MRKFFKPLIPSPRYSSIPYLNGPVINVGDWIRKWNSLQPRKRTLIFEDRPFTYRQLTLRANRLCPRLLDRGYTSGTTGLPKRAILSRRKTFSNALNAGLFYNLTSRDPRRRNPARRQGCQYSDFEFEFRRHPWLETSID